MKWRMFRILFLVIVTGTAAAAAEKKSDDQKEKPILTFEGEITEIQKIAEEVTVRKFPVSKTFLVAVTCTITTNDKTNAVLKDLKVGDRVKVKYEQEKDGLVARRIIIRGIDEEDRQKARENEQLERR